MTFRLSFVSSQLDEEQFDALQRALEGIRDADRKWGFINFVSIPYPPSAAHLDLPDLGILAGCMKGQLEDLLLNELGGGLKLHPPPLNQINLVVTSDVGQVWAIEWTPDGSVRVVAMDDTPIQWTVGEKRS